MHVLPAQEFCHDESLISTQATERGPLGPSVLQRVLLNDTEVWPEVLSYAESGVFPQRRSAYTRTAILSWKQKPKAIVPENDGSRTKIRQWPARFRLKRHMAHALQLPLRLPEHQQHEPKVHHSAVVTREPHRRAA